MTERTDHAKSTATVRVDASDGELSVAGDFSTGSVVTIDLPKRTGEG